MDTLSAEQRHNNMAAIKGKGTKPEMIVRKFLWSRGFRYRVNNARLPGHPDLVLRKYRTCIFVNGCFWHGHKNCRYYIIPKTNTDFWIRKITRNIERDRQEQLQLARMGWHCITVWECELKREKRDETLESLAYTLNHIYLKDRSQVYQVPEENGMYIAAEPSLHE
ncbi:MAG: DNA mismatch endonuclease Vsr [Prevotella salivae]|uniref:very short patch repair endonuclease n=1 Tax=Prevotella histicola TaxID=470565 RepID=UPI001CB269BE|nr:very short patch repair endonuclease [Prevotella histicola]MBF1529910.1 DNA mismatch endonuclease Vsr [Segatella salivae]